MELGQIKRADGGTEARRGFWVDGQQEVEKGNRQEAFLSAAPACVCACMRVFVCVCCRVTGSGVHAFRGLFCFHLLKRINESRQDATSGSDVTFVSLHAHTLTHTQLCSQCCSLVVVCWSHGFYRL